MKALRHPIEFAGIAFLPWPCTVASLYCVLHSFYLSILYLLMLVLYRASRLDLVSCSYCTEAYVDNIFYSPSPHRCLVAQDSDSGICRPLHTPIPSGQDKVCDTHSYNPCGYGMFCWPVPGTTVGLCKPNGFTGYHH